MARAGPLVATWSRSVGALLPYEFDDLAFRVGTPLEIDVVFGSVRPERRFQIRAHFEAPDEILI